MKLVYLVDLAYSQTHGGLTWTGFEWRFHHYGPYARELQVTLDAMEGIDADEEQRIEGERRFSVYGGAHGAQWDSELERLVEPTALSMLRTVIRRWAGVELNALLDYVYFETAPMTKAARGDVLDFSIPQDKLFRRRVPHNPTLSTELLARLRSRLAAGREESHGIPVATLTVPVGEREERLLRRAEGGPLQMPKGVVDITVGRKD